MAASAVDRVHRAAVLEVEEGSHRPEMVLDKAAALEAEEESLRREIQEYSAGFEEMKIVSLLYEICSS